MDKKNERTWRTIDERLSDCQANLEKCLEELKNNLNDNERQKLEKTKSNNEHNIHLLNCEKKRLLQCPTFLFLIANQFENQVLRTIPTYIETQDEAKYLTEIAMKNLLENDDISLGVGSYVGIIVRKTYYNKLSDTDKVDVQKIFHNEGVYVTSKEIIVSRDGISII